MVRSKLPDFSKFHCNPHKNGGLRRLLVICALVIVFVYGLQTTLIVKSSDQAPSGSSTSPLSTSLRPGQIRLEEPVSGAVQDVFLEANRCRMLSDPCDKPYFPYRISVGYGEHPPLVCWNLQDVPLKTSRPGTLTVLEIAVEDGEILSEKSSTADSPKSISSILAQLKSTRNDSYIVMVTWSAVPFSPTLSSHLKSVGTLINPKFLGQGVQFYLLGQKGLLPGRGISDVQVYNANPPLDRTGCVPPLASSLGNEIDHDFANSNSGYLTAGFYKTGTSVTNCGMSETCQGQMLPVHVYSGKDHNDPPKLCINGTYVFENRINRGGRGINIAVVNGPTGVVSRVGNFDTWGTDSIMLELFLEDLQLEETAIVFTHDEASTKLSDLARTLFFELGSSRIYDLKFRAAWFMVGQKGIRGFSGHEALKIGDKTNWAEPVDLKFCLERRLPGYPTRPDPLPESRNVHRLQFCRAHSSTYGDFCTMENKLAPLVPAKLADVSLVNSPVYSDLTVILVIAPLSHNLLRLLLETLLGQPGVNPRQVRIAHRLTNDTETEELVKLFSFHVFTPAIRSDYSAFVKSSIEETLKTFESRYVLLIEENTVLSPDFLYFLAVHEPLFEDDSTINAISAWNDNGFAETSGSLTRVYRVQGFPSQAWLATRTFLEGALQDKDCCSSQTSKGWFHQRKGISVVPDMSRIAKVVLQDSMTDSFEREMFLRARNFSMQNEVKIERDPFITAEKYADHLKSMIAQAAVFRPRAVSGDDLCQSSRAFMAAPSIEKNVALLMDRHEFQSDTWYQLCRCLQLFALPDYAPRNLYNGTLSFTMEQRLIILVAPDSSFYVNGKPVTLPVKCPEDIP